MHWLCFSLGAALVGALLPSVAATPGVVRTVDGQTLPGSIGFTHDAVLVDATNRVALTNLLRLESGVTAVPGTNAPARGQGRGLLGYYFGNMNLAGDPIVRLDETIDFDWGVAEPAPGVPRDSFSVAWCGEVEPPVSGSYTFALATDDGGRVFLDERPLIDAWRSMNGAASASPAVALEAGRRYALKVMFFEAAANARARLTWARADLPPEVVPRERLHPKSLLPGHEARLEGEHGLLATWYKTPEFSGPTVTLIESAVNWPPPGKGPGFLGVTAFSVRWTGRVRAERSEPHTFHVMTDEPARLWVDGRLVMEMPAQSFLYENKATVDLVAGERHDLRLETRQTGGEFVAQLTWSSPSMEKASIPPARLQPSRPAAGRGSATEGGDTTPPGVLLRNGTFVTCPILKATDTALRLGGFLRDKSISTVNVARIVCQPLSKAMAARLTHGRPGLLLSKGDFVDGDFRGIDGDRVRVNSILLGLRTYDLRKEVLAVNLREAGPFSAAFAVRLRDQSTLHASALTLEPDALVVQEATLGRVRLTVAEVAGIRRGASPDQSPFARHASTLQRFNA